MKKSELRQIIKEEISKTLNENTSQNVIDSLETNGFIKIRNKEEYLKVVPILNQYGYTFVGDKFSLNSTPFDEKFGSRRQPRKNSIYLMKYWSEDKTGKYDKFLWMADYLDRSRTSERFPIGTPMAR
jgi:hypothetical protein